MERDKGFWIRVGRLKFVLNDCRWKVLCRDLSVVLVNVSMSRCRRSAGIRMEGSKYVDTDVMKVGVIRKGEEGGCSRGVGGVSCSWGNSGIACSSHLLDLLYVLRRSFSRAFSFASDVAS